MSDDWTSLAWAALGAVFVAIGLMLCGAVRC